MGKLIELENKDDFKEIIKEGKTLVDFFAIWCGPCQMMKPLVDKLAEESADLKVVAVDVDKFPDIASDYQVMSIPTFVVFVNGEAKESRNGAMSEADLKKWVEKV
jgi:thioredoxin 1